MQNKIDRLARRLEISPRSAARLNANMDIIASRLVEEHGLNAVQHLPERYTRWPTLHHIAKKRVWAAYARWLVKQWK